LRIAQVAPLYESVPPKLYGGTERVVSFLTEELVRQGHDVTLFASGDSRTSAQLVATSPAALRLAGGGDPVARHLCMLDEVFRRAHDFDVIHFHTEYLHFPYGSRLDVPRVTTMHGRMDLPDLAPVLRRFPREPLVSISDAQRSPVPFANWIGTVHHGLPDGRLRFQPERGRYLAFLGRVCPEKRPDRAIEIAVRTGLPLKIAAKVDRADRDYFEREIEPMLDHPLVSLVGEIGDDRKAEFLGGALALLFPIDWPEPFGLVMIESMACGTPVIAFARGAVPEVMRDGVSGYVVSTVEGAVEAIRDLGRLDRTKVRRYFESRFSVTRMADAYQAIYARLAGYGAGMSKGRSAPANSPGPVRERLGSGQTVS
jgi:glycosyltransferase involved in cell wall biosynthesis